MYWGLYFQIARLVLLHLLAHFDAVSSLKVGVKLNYDHGFFLT